MTTIATEPALSHGSGTTDAFERHIVPRGQGPADGALTPKGAIEPPGDKTLCGKLWDRLRPTTGKMCEACVAEYHRRHPGMPLPTR